jgi:hypothetical protein
MEYKRQEGFRMEFSEPIEAVFRIIRLGGKEITSKEGEMKLCDISLRGARVSTIYELPTEKGEVDIEIQFAINEQIFACNGKIIWKKKGIKEYVYGVHFQSDSYSEDDLIDELKKYARKRLTK